MGTLFLICLLIIVLQVVWWELVIFLVKAAFRFLWPYGHCMLHNKRMSVCIILYHNYQYIYVEYLHVLFDKGQLHTFCYDYALQESATKSWMAAIGAIILVYPK